jgi:hypothetical protein
MAGERKGGGSAGGGGLGRGRSLIGALHVFLRPRDSGPRPEGRPPNPFFGTALRSQTGYGAYLTPFSGSDPTRHWREGDWVCLRPPIPASMTAEGQRPDLVVVRLAPSARGGKGGRGEGGKGGEEKAESPNDLCAVRRGRALLPPALGSRVRRPEGRTVSERGSGPDPLPLELSPLGPGTPQKPSPPRFHASRTRWRPSRASREPAWSFNASS